MGKAKKRAINKNTNRNNVVLKRTEIIQRIISDIHTHNVHSKTIEYINLFGVTLEELSESGADYEELSAVKHLLY